MSSLLTQKGKVTNIMNSFTLDTLCCIFGSRMCPGVTKPYEVYENNINLCAVLVSIAGA